MRSVLISVHPKYCGLIASEKKTVEIRKTRPKIETPFNCYIYCTCNGITAKERNFNIFTDLRCKVIGEFVCDQIEPIAVSRCGGDGILRACGGNEVWYGGRLETMSCLTTEEICKYIGGIGGKGYGWHISHLQIYDNPKELCEFSSASSRLMFNNDDRLSWTGMSRPPQSWCYVELIDTLAHTEVNLC